MISERLLALVRCPDCHGAIVTPALECSGCGRRFEAPGREFLLLTPKASFSETTKFLDEQFHSDGRDETVSPPLLSAGVRYAMLRRFLDLHPDDIVLDLGCGSGRFGVWCLQSGAQVIGIDTGTFFAAEARAGLDLVVGELRQLPFADGSITKAYAIDVLEHLSEEGLLARLREVSRILAPGGALFIYTHLHQRSRLAPVLNAIARAASTLERGGFADLTIEKLRKTDHLNPLKGRKHLDEVAASTGFEIAKFRYYTPVFSSLTENIIVPVAAYAMARRAARRASSKAVGRDAMRAARVEAKKRVGTRGLAYRALQLMTRATMLDVYPLGALKSGPFFALFVKKPPRR